MTWYKLVLPDTHNSWTKTSSSALQTVFGSDELGAKVLTLFQSSLQPGTYRNYGSNMTEFFHFFEESAITPLDITNIDIARNLA